MSSKTQIANMALIHLGHEKPIANLDTEKSSEAATMRAFYDLAVDTVLSKVAWPFATTFGDAGLIETEPNTEWAFSYRYPSNCITVRRVLSGLRNDNRKQKVPFKIGDDDTGQLFWCDEQDAIIEYTKRVTQTSRFAADFTLTLSYYLAYLTAPGITGGDEFKLGEKSFAFYENNLLDAENRAFNEQQDEVEPESIFITGR
jgi:hypothetical protein